MPIYALAVDIGGTKLEAALVSDAGELLAASRSRRETGSATTISSISTSLVSAVAETMAHLPLDARLVAAGIGTAGPISRITGQAFPVNMLGVRGIDLVSTVSRVLGNAAIPVVMGHDGGCLALAESWLGAATDARAALSIVVSTGVGGGFTIAGEYLGGASGNAGHLGQVRTGDGLTVEEVASGPGSVAWARRHGWTGQSGEDLAREAASGVAIARAAIERSAQALGEALANASTLIDLDLVVIGGGFSRVSADYVSLVHGALVASAVHEYSRRTRVVRSALGDEGPLIGAAALALRSAP